MYRSVPQILMLALSSCIAGALVGCAPAIRTQHASSIQEMEVQIANPASVNCARQGGTLAIQKRGDDGEYGVCMFADNRQCEEWAMFRGDCPVGGIKIAGYFTEAARYCAITGGKYQVTDNSNTDREQGTCIFKNGNSCDAWEYFAGKCNPGNEAGDR